MATSPRFSLLLLAYLAFVSLGLPDGLLGVGWPAMRGDLGVPTEAVGLLLTAGTVGYLTSSVLAGFGLARLGVGRLLAVSTLLASLALTGYATAPALAVVLGCALVLGLGSGAVDAGLNAYAAGAFGPRHMNWLHAFFGLGVALGPLIMTAAITLDLSWRVGYGLVAAGQLVLALAFALTVRAWGDRSPAPDRASAPSPVPSPVPSPAPAAAGAATAPAVVAEPARVGPPVRETLRLPAVWLGTLAFVLYVSIEIGTGLWAYLLLTEGRGLGAAAAGICVSGYWGSLFVGRVVQGVTAERLGSGRVLRGSLVGMAVGAVLVALPGPAWLAMTGLAVIGFAAAPVFPLLTLTTAERVGAGHADRAIGLQIGAAGLGGALVPAGIGVLVARTSVEALGPALVVLALGLIVLHAAANRRPAVAPGAGNRAGRGDTGNRAGRGER